MPANVMIRIGATTSGAVSEIEKVNSALGKQMTGAQKASSAIRSAAIPAAIALGLVGKASIDAAKAAAEDQAEQTKLAGVLERTTGATALQVAATEDWIAKTSRQVAVADTELRPALGKLATATGDVHVAQQALNVALDVSAQTGKSLDSVSTALAKGYTGNTAALNRLVPGLDQTVIKSKDMTLVMAELARVTGGAATEAANTATGQYANLQIQMGELQETLGAALLPLMGKLNGVLLTGVDFLSKHAAAVQVVVAAIALLAGGIIALNIGLKVYQAGLVAVKIATGIWTAAQWLLNAALTANPLALVTIAVVALGAAIVIAYQHSATFRSIVSAAMSAVQAAIAAVGRAFSTLAAAAESAFAWIVGHWKLAAFAFGPLGAAIVLIATHFDTVKNAGVGAFNAVKSAIDAVSGAIHAAISAVESLIGSISRIHIPHISIPNPFSLPPVPGAPSSSRSRASSASSGGGTTINVYGAVDPEGTARAIKRVLAAHDRRIGLGY